MADIKIRLKAKAKKGVIDVKALITHPMESGRRMNKKTGSPYPKHYITDVAVMLNGKEVVTGNLTPAVSQNPYLAFEIPGNAGDEITLSVVDNLGDSGKSVVKVK